MRALHLQTARQVVWFLAPIYFCARNSRMEWVALPSGGHSQPCTSHLNLVFRHQAEHLLNPDISLLIGSYVKMHERKIPSLFYCHMQEGV